MLIKKIARECLRKKNKLPVLGLSYLNNFFSLDSSNSGYLGVLVNNCLLHWKDSYISITADSDQVIIIKLFLSFTTHTSLIVCFNLSKLASSYSRKNTRRKSLLDETAEHFCSNNLIILTVTDTYIFL